MTIPTRVDKQKGLKMNEELFWKRATNLWRIMNSITDDLVYKAMWEEKLKELMKKGFKQ